jgi:hypothetical protein
LPWNFPPLPILAFLGLPVLDSVAYLRYLSIFLFVLRDGPRYFTYRFAGIDETTIALPLPGGR